MNPAAGLIGTFLLAVYPPEIVLENLTLTEGQLLFFSLGLLYWSLKLADTHKTKHFLLLALYLRLQVALYPIPLLIYLLMKRYPFHIDEASDSIFILKIHARKDLCMYDEKIMLNIPRFT